MKTKECQFCLSEIPEKAEKCKFCLEWQESKKKSTRSKTDIQDLNFLTKYPNSNIPFQLKMVSFSPFNYLVSVLIIGVLFFAIIQLSWYKLDEEQIYLLSFLAFTVQLIFSWAGLILVYKLITRNYLKFVEISPLDDIQAEQKYVSYHDKIFDNKKSVFFGVLIGLIASVGDFVVGTPFISVEAKLIFAIFEFINMSFAGAAIYSMFIFAFFLYHISSNPNRDELHLDKNIVILGIGKIHLKTTILAIVPLFLGVIAKFFGDWNWNLLIIVWYVLFAIIIIFYIYIPMLHIHNLMKWDIDSQIEIIHKKIQSILIEINFNPSSRNFIKLNELRALEKSISSQNTWPFDFKSLSAAFIAIIFPIMLIVIDKIWSI